MIIVYMLQYSPDPLNLNLSLNRKANTNQIKFENNKPCM